MTNPPHLYPTHYSTPGYVSYYLIRKIPEFMLEYKMVYSVPVTEFLDVFKVLISAL